MKRLYSFILVLVILCGTTFVTFASSCEHEYVEEYVANTCTEDGYRIDRCVKCGDTKNEAHFTAFGHQDNDYDLKCDRCGKKTTGFGEILRTFILRIWAKITELLGF